MPDRLYNPCGRTKHSARLKRHPCRQAWWDTQKWIKFKVCVCAFFFEVGHLIPSNQHSLKVNRYTRKWHFGEKPCGFSLVNCLWLCELDEFQWSSCCSFIKGSSSWSIALSCLTEITEMIGNKRQNHSPCIMFQMKETKSVLRARV